MATNPYSVGGTVAPETRLPDDYQRVQASPESFGGAIARGATEAGQGAVKASLFYGQIATDDAINKYETGLNNLLHGDPNKLGPDGQPETGFYGLRGEDAMKQYPSVMKQMEDLRAQIRSNLSTPESQLQFDQQSRRLQQLRVNEMGTVYERANKDWGHAVNAIGARNQMTNISNDAYNDNAFGGYLENLKIQYVRDAHLQGLGEPGAQEAVAKASQDAWKQRLETISVKDPALAAQLAEQHQKELGQFYEPLAHQFRARNDQAIGIGAANYAYATARNVPLMPSTQGRPSTDAIHNAIIGQESGGNPNEPPSINGARGVGQIMPGTFARYAKPGERIDNFADNLAVSRRIVDDLATKYNNDPERVAVAYFSGEGNVAPAGNPTPWRQDLADGNGKLVSSYVADIQKRLGQSGPLADVHLASFVQQSPQAAGTANPSLPSVDAAPPVVSAPPAPPQAAQPPVTPTPLQIKAAAYRVVDNNPDLTREQKEHAYTEINRLMAEQQIMDQANEKARRDANEKAANGYVTRILNGDSVGIIRQIANDPALEWQTKEHLFEAARKHSGNDVEEAAHAYGPGFWSVYKAVTAAPGDPTRIADATQLLQRAGDGGDLTLAGVQKLMQTMQLNQKSVNDAAVNTTKVGLLNYAKGKLSFDQEMMFPGVPPLKDPKGMQIFEGQFIPKFEAAYDQWMKDGKDPWTFLTQKNVDAMVEGMRPKAQMAMDRLAASGEAAPPDPNAKLPPAPQGVDTGVWSKVIAMPPPMENGKPFPYAAWGHAVSNLLVDPSPENIRLFNESKFGKSGVDGKQILDEFRGKAQPSVATVPNPFGGD